MPRQDWLVIIAKEDRQPEPRLGRHSDARERASDGCAQPETTENSQRDRTGSSPIRGPLSSSITPAGALSEAAVELKPWQLHAQQLQTRTKGQNMAAWGMQAIAREVMMGGGNRKD